jgi:hypothetical protein
MTSVTNIASLATARTPRAAWRPKPLPRRCRRATRAASRSRLRASSIRPPKYRLTGVRMPTARPLSVNRERPHRGLDLGTPIDSQRRADAACRHGPVERRDLLGGLIHEYSRAAA